MPNANKKTLSQAESFGDFLGIIVEDIITGNQEKKVDSISTPIDTSLLGEPILQQSTVNIPATAIQESTGIGALKQPESVQTESLDDIFGTTPDALEQPVAASQEVQSLGEVDIPTGLAPTDIVAQIPDIATQPFTAPTVNQIQRPSQAEPIAAKELGPQVISKEDKQAQRIAGEEDDFFTQELDILKSIAVAVGSDPIVQDQLAQIAMALGAKDPGSFGFQLGKSISEEAQGKQAAQLRQHTLDVIAGREPLTDPNLLTIGAETRESTITSAIQDEATALGIQQAQTRIATPQERELAFATGQQNLAKLAANTITPAQAIQVYQLNAAQIGLTKARTTASILQAKNIMAATGTPITSTDLSLYGKITLLGNAYASSIAGSESKMIISPTGEVTYQIENPTAFHAAFNEFANAEIDQAINTGAASSALRTLKTAEGANPEDQKRADQVMFKQFPDAKFIGTKTIPNGVDYIYTVKVDGKDVKKAISVTE